MLSLLQKVAGSSEHLGLAEAVLSALCAPKITKANWGDSEKVLVFLIQILPLARHLEADQGLLHFGVALWL